MSFRRGTVYHFDDKTDTGISEIPVGRIIIVQDFDGETRSFIYVDNTGITTSTTIEEAFLGNNLSVASRIPTKQGIGIPGYKGFGVGYTNNYGPYLTPMSGCEDVESDNYGNFTTSNGSVFVYIPKFYFKWDGNTLSISDNDEGGTYALHRAFINAGVEKDGFFISKYQAGNESGDLVFKQGLDPVSTDSSHNPIANLSNVTENIYASAIKAPKSLGSDFHCVSIFQLNALALIAYAAGKAGTNCAFADSSPLLPKGNNNDALGDVDDGTVSFTGSGYDNCANTGSGSPFAKTTHNGQNCGVPDVNGNMNDIAIGLTRAGTSSTDTGESGDNTDFYILKESFDIASLTMDWTSGDSPTDSAYGDSAYLSGANSPYDNVTFSGVTTDNNWVYLGNGSNQVFDYSTDRNSADYKQSACGLGSSNGHSASGTTEFGNDGQYHDNKNNLQPLVSGHWNHSGGAGVFYVPLSDHRTYSNHGVGFRASLYS